MRLLFTLLAIIHFVHKIKCDLINNNDQMDSGNKFLQPFGSTGRFGSDWRKECNNNFQIIWNCELEPQKQEQDKHLSNLLSSEKVFLLTKSKQLDPNLSLPKNKQSNSAEEPHFIILRRESNYPINLDYRPYMDFIPPRGKKNKQIDAAFEPRDDFYPVRGRKRTEILNKKSQHAVYDEDLFYPNRGKRTDYV